MAPPAVKPSSRSPDQQLLVRAQHWQGPLPPPELLAKFDQVIPNGAERIMSMVEREQAHRIASTNQALNGQIKDHRRGQWLGVSLGALSIVGAVLTAYFGAHPTVSVALVGLPIVGIIRSIMGKRTSTDKEGSDS